MVWPSAGSLMKCHDESSAPLVCWGAQFCAWDLTERWFESCQATYASTVRRLVGLESCSAFFPAPVTAVLDAQCFSDAQRSLPKTRLLMVFILVGGISLL